MTTEQLEEMLFERLIPGPPQVKVARLIGDCTPNTELFDDGIRDRLISDHAGPQGTNDRIVDDALSKLSRRADIDVFGNPLNWRFSKIRQKNKAG